MFEDLIHNSKNNLSEEVIIDAYKSWEKAGKHDKDEIFVGICDMFFDVNSLGNHQYLILVGQTYQMINDYVKSTYNEC
jgi:hypothetical protein